MELVLRKYGNLLDVTTPEIGPTPECVFNLLAAELQYNHVTVLRGEARYSVDGTQRGVNVECRRLFEVSEGRLTTGFGFYSKIVELLRATGYRLRYVDLSPPRRRPDCYTPDWANMMQYIKFRPRQDECLQAMMHYPGGIINAPTGFGKTHTMCAYCHLYPRARIDLVVRPTDVAHKLYRQLSRTIPNVGMVGGGLSVRGDRVRVFTAGSLHHADGDADILLADEVHQLVTPDVGETLTDKYLHARVYGFTATPKGRMDGAHAQLELFFGREIFTMTYEEAVALGLVVPIVVRWLPIHLSGNPARDKTGVSKNRWGIWRNDERNQIIAQDVRRYPSDHQVLILCSSIEHAVYLWRELPEFALCYGNMKAEQKHGFMVSGLVPESFQVTDATRREQLKTEFEQQTLKKVIATDVWATGVDFESLPTVYRVDARQSEILDTQAPGRVSRIDGEKTAGEVVDCYDAYDPGFKRKSETRRRHYRALGWEQRWPNRGGHFANYG